MAYFNCSAKNAACQGRSAAEGPVDCTANSTCGNTEECASCFESPGAPSTCDSPHKEESGIDPSCCESSACCKSGQNVFTLLLLLLLVLLLTALL
ncbi:MAG: hypothetical protein IJZ33_01360 [Clostridia bacterium]|nr:hypothetical protein [Clostridia bacterium]